MQKETITLLHNETKVLLEDMKKSSGDYIELFNTLEEFRKSRDETFKEKLGDSFNWNIYKPSHILIGKVQEEMYHEAIGVSKDNPDLINNLREFFLEPFGMLRARYELVAQLGDSESVELVFDTVDEQFELEADDPDFDKSCFYGLPAVAKISTEYRDRVIDLLRNGFNRAIESADDDFVNDKIFNIAGQLLVLLNDKESATEIYKAFVFSADKEQDYVMNLAASRLSLCLTALEYDGPVDALEKFITDFSKTHGDDEFVVRTRYAYWWLNNETEEALAFLIDPARKKNLGLIAALLADLNKKNALPILKKLISQLENKVTIEIFKEAINRLEHQQNIPDEPDRMIWMFGFITRVDMALGNESDNVFMERANAISGEDYGIVYEVDDSSPDDF